MKFKKIKETRKKISKNFEMVTTTYTEDPNGELKVTDHAPCSHQARRRQPSKKK